MKLTEKCHIVKKMGGLFFEGLGICIPQVDTFEVNFGSTVMDILKGHKGLGKIT